MVHVAIVTVWIEISVHVYVKRYIENGRIIIKRFLTAITCTRIRLRPASREVIFSYRGAHPYRSRVS